MDGIRRGVLSSVVLAMACGGIASLPSRDDAGIDASTLEGGSADTATDSLDAKPKPYAPWVRVYGSAPDGQRGVATGPAGEIVRVGEGVNPISFGGPVVQGVSVVGLDRLGAHRFTLGATRAKGTTLSLSGIAIDDDGVTHLFGSFSGALDFGGGTETGQGDTIYVALSPAGLELRHRVFHNVRPRSLGVSPQGDVYLLFVAAGGNVELGNGPSLFSQSDLVMVRYGPSLVPAWRRIVGNIGTSDYGYDYPLRVGPGGEVLFAGSSFGDAVIDVDVAPWKASPNLWSFFAVLDGGGATKLARRFGGLVAKADFDDAGNVLVAVQNWDDGADGGAFYGPGVAKWTAAGTFAWVRRAGWYGNVLRLLTRASPNIDVLFHAPSGGPPIVDGGGAATFVLRRFDADGNDKGVVLSLAKTALPFGAERDPFGSLVLTGAINAPTDFGTGSVSPVSEPFGSLFIASLHP